VAGIYLTTVCILSFDGGEYLRVPIAPGSGLCPELLVNKDRVEMRHANQVEFGISRRYWNLIFVNGLSGESEGLSCVLLRSLTAPRPN
jgi:hypothetical protein